MTTVRMPVHEQSRYRFDKKHFGAVHPFLAQANAKPAVAVAWVDADAGTVAKLLQVVANREGSELLIQEPRTLGVRGFSTRQRENEVIPKSNSWSS